MLWSIIYVTVLQITPFIGMISIIWKTLCILINSTGAGNLHGWRRVNMTQYLNSNSEQSEEARGLEVEYQSLILTLEIIV